MSVAAYESECAQFYTKEEVMRAGRWLVETYMKRPQSMNGVKIPFGLTLRGGYPTLDYTINYYGTDVGRVTMDTFRITYLM